QRASGFAYQRERLGVGFAQPALAVEDEHDDVGHPDRGQRLADDTFGHPLMPAKLEAAAVDHDEFAAAVDRAGEIEVARSAGNCAGDRAAAPGDSIEQRRLAGVCAANQHHGRQAFGGNPPRLGARRCARIGHSPNSASLRGSRVQSRSTLTMISKNMRAPRISSSSRRAAVPISLSVRPPAPISMPLCDSRSTTTVAPILLSLRSASSSNFSTLTAVENGISWRILRKIFSRMISSAIIRSL